MSEMIERVAAAISDQRQRQRYGSVMTPWSDQAMAESFRQEQREIARAAVEAMRSPSDAMCKSAVEYDSPCDIWQAMIDQALKD